MHIDTWLLAGSPENPEGLPVAQATPTKVGKGNVPQKREGERQRERERERESSA